MSARDCPRRRLPLSLAALILCALLAPRVAAGEQPRDGRRTIVERTAIDTGIQNSGCIIQDSDGFLWIGTVRGGLCRSDGYELKVFKPGGSGSISSASIYGLHEDRSGTLWIATDNGLNRYDKATDAFVQYRHDPAQPGSISHDSWQFPSVQVMDEDERGRIWIGTRAGLDMRDPHSDRFVRYMHDPADPASLSSDDVRAVFVDRAGTLWAGTGNGLNRLDEASGKFTRYQNDPGNPRSLGNNTVVALCEDLSGGLWVGTENGLYRLDPKGAGFARYMHDPSDPTTPRADFYFTISRDSSGILWLSYINAKRAGLSALDPRTGVFTHYIHDPADPHSLSGNAISSVMEDRAGTLWIVNDMGIVDKLDPRRPPFTVYRGDASIPTGLPHPYALRIIQDRRGTIWISTRPAGLTAFDKGSGRFTRVLTDRYYSAVLEDDAGMFWLASTLPGTLHSFDPRTGRILRSWTHIPGDPTSLTATPQIMDIVQDRKDRNRLWLMTHGGGMERFDMRTGTFTHFTHDEKDPGSVSGGNAWMIYQDPEGSLWIPTQGAGLDRLDTVTGTVRHYPADPEGNGGPSSDSLLCVFQDASRALWIGSSVGFDRMDPAAGTFTHFTKGTGFPGASVVAIGPDVTGVLWMGTVEEGLLRFDPRTGKTKLFGERDGLHGDTCSPWNALRDRDGEMWFSGPKGVTRFWPRDIIENTYVPPVVLTALKQGGEPLITGSSPERTKTISLDWRSNFFEFEYAALSFTQAEKNRYRYMLEGWDKGWFDAGTRRFGRFSGLKPGTYTLRVSGSNNDGIWNTAGVALRVVITPPWWLTWWFISLAAAAAFGALFAVFWSVRSRRLAVREAARAIRESEERYRILFENTPIGVSVTTAEGRLLASNEIFNSMLGYASDEVRQLKPSRVYRDPSDRSRIIEEVGRKSVVRNFETTWVRKDGATIQVSLMVSPIFLRGEPVLLTVVSDIGERKAAEAERSRLWERLREQADRVQSIMDAVPDGVLLLDAQGRIVLANPAAQGALAVLVKGDPSAPALLGNMPLSELLSPPPEGAWHTVETEGPSPRVFETIAKPVASGALAGSWAVVVREVTREREMQQRLRQHEKLAAVGQLTAGIAHDFNNLLTTINGFAELGSSETSAGDAREWMSVILQSGRRAADLVRQLLAFSRRQVIEPRVLNLNDTVASMDKLLQRVIGEDVALITRLAPNLWPTRVDPTQIEQVVMNLAVNARDAMPKGGTLTVETANLILDMESAVVHQVERAGEYVVLSISDTGVGMTDDVKAHLFEPFFTTKEKGRGTGLGLATVFGIVKQTGGAISAYSEPGHGSVFRIYLPRALEAAAQAAAPVSEAAQAPSEGITILVVEDDRGVLEFALRILRRLGYTVLEAANADEALKTAETHHGPIHLLLTDVIMPGMNGRDLADKLTARRPDMRVLFMSGYTDSVIDFRDLVEAGAPFLQKPFLTADLSRRVREALGGPPR